jgi:putative heme transporter
MSGSEMAHGVEQGGREAVDAELSGFSVLTEEEEMPRVRLTRRQVVAFVIFILSAVAFLYFVLPKLTGVGTTVHRIERGDSWWIAVGVLLEVLSFAGYVVLFRAVFVTGDGRIGWRESYEITMAGLAATRLFAAAGAGGVALTAWALRRSGMEPRLVACRMVAFIVLLYVVYAGSLLIDGLGLGIGLFPGDGSFALTFLPAIVAIVLFVVAGAIALLPGDIERRLARGAPGNGRIHRLLGRLATAPALTASGVRTAIGLIRAKDAGVLGAVAWWGFDISVLWAMFHAFGSVPPFTVIWMAYFLGMVGNLLPLPGGLGGVEGGMIGAFAAFNVNLELAVLAVLSYRAISFWLPTFPGAVAYFQLRRTVARWREEQSSEPAGGQLSGGSESAAPAGAV